MDQPPESPKNGAPEPQIRLSRRVFERRPSYGPGAGEEAAGTGRPEAAAISAAGADVTEAEAGAVAQNPLLRASGPVITQEAQSYGRHGYGVRVDDPRLARQFTDEVHGAYLEPDGTNIIDRIVTEHTGAPVTRRQVPADGWFRGDQSPNTSFELNEGADRRQVELVSALHGLLEGQDAVAWYKRLPDGDPGGTEGWVVTAPHAGKLSQETIAALRDVVNSEERFTPLRDAHIREGQLLFRNFTELPDETYQALLHEAVEMAPGIIEVHPGTFDGALYDGTWRYLQALGRHPDLVRQARDLLVARVGPVYERWAAAGFGDAAAIRQRIADRVASLDAYLHELENPPLRGNTRGLTIEEAAKRIRSRFLKIRANTSPARRLDIMYERFNTLVQDFLRAQRIPPEMAKDWYKGAAGNQRAILRLLQPELADDTKYVISTFIHSILSNGQEVPKETASGAHVMEQYLRTGRISLLDPSTAELSETPIQRIRPGGTVVARQKAARGREGRGIGGAPIPLGRQWLTHEVSLRRLDRLIRTLGEKGAVDYLLGSRTLKNGRVEHNATELFGAKIGILSGGPMGVTAPVDTGREVLDRPHVVSVGIQQVRTQGAEAEPLAPSTFDAAVVEVEAVDVDVGPEWRHGREGRGRKAEAGHPAGLAPIPRRGRGGDPRRGI